MSAPQIFKILKRLEKLENDTSWITATLSDEFVPYNNNTANTPKYRKIGKIVEIIGSVSPAEEITSTTEYHTIFTLPAGYRPNSTRQAIEQGSGSAIWYFRVATSGSVSFTRYRNEEGYITATTSAWLPFNITYMVD